VLYLVTSGAGSSPGSNRAPEGRHYSVPMAESRPSAALTRPVSLIVCVGLILAGLGILAHMPVVGLLGVGLGVTGFAIKRRHRDSAETISQPSDP
jgi:hypothetical protein